MSKSNLVLEQLIKKILQELGENPNRQGLKKSPERIAKSLQYLTNGYQQNIKQIVNGAVFKDQNDEMILVKNIEVYSLCEHHLLPFFGKCHIAYIPNGKIIGLSKLPRIVDFFAKRLQIQERLTHQVAKTIQDVLKPMGVGVIVEAFHLCMMMRGVEKQNSKTVTSCMLGAFRRNAPTRQEFLQLIKV